MYESAAPDQIASDIGLKISESVRCLADVAKGFAPTVLVKVETLQVFISIFIWKIHQCFMNNVTDHPPGTPRPQLTRKGEARD